METKTTMVNSNIQAIQSEELCTLKLAKKVLFGEFEIECYEDATRENGDFFMTRRQIAESLGYNDEKSFHKSVQRKQSAVGLPRVDKLSTVDGKMREVELYTFEQFFELIDGNRQPKAEAFRKWAVLTLKELVTGRAELQFKNKSDQLTYETNIALLSKVDTMQHQIVSLNSKVDCSTGTILTLTSKLSQVEETLREIDSKFFIPYNKKTKFEQLKLSFLSAIKFRDTTNYNEFYKHLQNWFGYNFPRNVNTKEWFINTIGVEELEAFVNGVIIKRIVKSDKGNWIDLGGYKNNNIEFERVKKEFNNQCAYCGKEDIEIVGEHIFPQSNPNSTDIIYNIVPACYDCNYSKFNHKVLEWYSAQPFFQQERVDALEYHWNKYHINIKK
jgi:prophage antirepressor-like protein